MIKRTWKVYGLNGHRQKESFNQSKNYDFSEPGIPRLISIKNSDITGTNEYSIITITRATAAECQEELYGQLSDGVFENCRTGYIEEIPEA